jgi:hypothetical protein
MNRLHPQDLRAIMAAIILPGVGADHQHGIDWKAATVKDVDLLLAELERTAKPESAPAGPCRFDTDGDGNCPIHPKGCPPARTCSEVDETAPLSALAKGCHRAHPHEDDPDCPANLAFRHGLREGAREERERIIALLWEHGLVRVANPEALRHYLESKP